MNCDFCKEVPVWVYPAHDFQLPDLNWASETGWAACDICSDLVEMKAYDVLADRAMKVGGWEEWMKDVLLDLYAKFDVARSGDRQRIMENFDDPAHLKAFDQACAWCGATWIDEVLTHTKECLYARIG